MRYVIEDENGDSVSLEAGLRGTVLALGVEGAVTAEFEFTLDEFKEFRRAVGYVWQEVEDK